MSITEKVKKYLAATGAVEAAKRNFEGIFEKFKKNGSPISQKAKRILEESLGSETLLDIMATVYEEFYSEEEIDAAIAFYETPIGKSMASKAGQVMATTASMLNARVSRALNKILKEIVGDLDDGPEPWRAL